MKKLKISKQNLMDFSNKVDFLCNLKLTKNNNKIITKYFFDEFTNSPGLFGDFITYIKGVLESGEDKLKNKLSKRYLKIISFLCERFGLYEDKLVLDDLCFKITKPKDYNKISTKLEKYKKNSTEIIGNIFKVFKDKLEENNIEAKVTGRYKNIFSVYKKILKKNNLDVLKLKDIFAFRIITKSNDAKVCFEILNILHDSFMPIPSRFKDYISIPKINGYQSIHTGLMKVISDLDLAIEVQIRTENMHNIAESGVAAHYLYSRNKKASITDRKEMKLFKHITSDSIKYDLDKDIYCLTPSGDIYKMKKNSSILEFAMKIHSEVGRKARYAIVNGEEKKLNEKINNWDKIKIIT